MDINNAQTIAQIKQQAPNLTPESLWHWASALPTSFEAEIWYALVFGAILGMFAHYLRGRSQNSISGSPLEYFLHDNVWRSVAAAMSIGAELFAEIGTGLFTTEAGAFVGWGIVMMSGIKTGYLGDSLVNKGSRIEWTPEQRAAVAITKAP